MWCWWLSLRSCLFQIIIHFQYESCMSSHDAPRNWTYVLWLETNYVNASEISASERTCFNQFKHIHSQLDQYECPTGNIGATHVMDHTCRSTHCVVVCYNGRTRAQTFGNAHAHVCPQKHTLMWRQKTLSSERSIYFWLTHNHRTITES